LRFALIEKMLKEAIGLFIKTAKKIGTLNQVLEESRII